MHGVSILVAESVVYTKLTSTYCSRRNAKECIHWLWLFEDLLPDVTIDGPLLHEHPLNLVNIKVYEIVIQLNPAVAHFKGSVKIMLYIEVFFF